MESKITKPFVCLYAWFAFSDMSVGRSCQFYTYSTQVASYLSVLAGRKELFQVCLNGKVQGARVHFSPPQLSKFPRAGELSGSDPRAGPFWPEPVLRTRVFHLRTDWSGRTDRTNRKQPQPFSPESYKLYVTKLALFSKIKCDFYHPTYRKCKNIFSEKVRRIL